MRRVDLMGIHIEASSGAPIVLLREREAPYRVLPIFVGAAEASAIAMALSGQLPPRPMTHDLMAALVAAFGAHLDAVEVTDLRDGTFYGELTLTGPAEQVQRVDSRPSDAIALAVRVGAPVFVSEAVLDAAGAHVTATPDEQEIDEAVAEFRRVLDDLDPSDLVGEISDDNPPTGPPGETTEPDEGDQPDEGRGAS